MKKELLLNSEIEKLRDECKYLKKVCLQLNLQLEDVRNQIFDVGDVDSEYCEVSELQVDNFDAYYNSMLEKYPVAARVMEAFFSKHFINKQHNSSTSDKWQQSASLYQSFMLDMFLKSKSSKSVLRTNLLLGVVLLHAEVPNIVWQILQRLRVLPARDTVEKYLKNVPIHQPPLQNFKYCSLDNCEIFIHTNSPTSFNKSNMLHLVSRLVFDIPRQITISVDEIFLPYNVAEGLKFT